MKLANPNHALLSLTIQVLRASAAQHPVNLDGNDNKMVLFLMVSYVFGIRPKMYVVIVIPIFSLNQRLSARHSVTLDMCVSPLLGSTDVTGLIQSLSSCFSSQRSHF